MWWYNILGDNKGSTSHLLWFDNITAWSFLLTYNIVFLRRGNSDPILTVKIIEWRKFIEYFGLSIEVNPSRVSTKNVYLFVLGLNQYLHMNRSIYQGTIWTKSLIWNYQSYIGTN